MSQMDVSLPHAAVSPGAEGEVLVTLARTTAGLTGRQIAARAKRTSQASINRALQRLVRQGVVQSQPVGRAILYTLNRDHLAYPAVAILSGMRADLIRRLAERLRAAPEPLHASLFGSAARADGDVESDIDLFIVRPLRVSADDSAWRARLDALRDDVRRWTGNALSVAEISTAELGRLRRIRPEIVRDLETDAVVLVGEQPNKLLRRSR